jgi:subtilisin
MAETSNSGQATSTGIASGVSNTAHQYGETSTQARDFVTDRVSVAAGETLTLSDLTEHALTYTRQNPGKSMLFSAVIGFLLGRLLQRPQPVTDRRFIAPSREPAFSSARQVLRSPELQTAQEVQIAKEFVITQPRGFRAASRRYADELTELSPTLEILDSFPDGEAQLALMTDREVEQLKARFPGLIIEPNILYKKCRPPLLESFEVIHLPAAARTRTLSVKVLDERTGLPINGALVLLFRDLDHPSGFEGTTDNDGNCELVIPDSRRQYAALMVFPQYGYWGRLDREVAFDRVNKIPLRSLPSSESAFYDWGHQFAQMHDGLPINPEEIKIGIIDTGICKDHPAITPAGGYNCVSGEDSSLWEDIDGHGTHVAGVVAATISKSGKGIKGYVPQAQIYSYRAIGEDGATSWDLAKAIDRAVDEGCDIINMSLGSPTPTDVVKTSIARARDGGVLCIAATGNQRKSVYYPAAFKSVLGVGAFGKFGVYPPDSVHLTSETNIRSTDGVYYLASFSNFGDGLDFCAPGVAILSTVPGGDYCAWDGTSMACPQVTGIAALALAAHQDIFKATRDADRVQRLIHILKSRTQKLNFGSEYEGEGSLTVPSVL